MPDARAAMPAQRPLVAGCHATPPVTTEQQGRFAMPPALAIAWAMEAAGVTFYMASELLVGTIDDRIPGATGTLVWVCQAGQRACLLSAVHPALLVQTASTSFHAACVEFVPHLTADDPLRRHMELVLQTAFEANDTASQLYAVSLADALAIHFLRRYAACQSHAPVVPTGLSPAKLQRTIAHIQTHLEEALSLTTLATVVQMSPNHFAALFKRATGRTPHHYVLECRIARAKRLLSETDVPLSAIGPQIGWTDQSYFTALFRKHVAMTPKAYRDATQRA